MAVSGKIVPRMAVSCVLKRDNRYLMVRRGAGQSAGDYAFPGGKVEAGESLHQAVLRELEEETGIVALNPQFFRLYDLISRDETGKLASHYVLAVHLAKASGNQIAIAADDAVEADWYTAEEIRTLQVPPSVMECIEYFELHADTVDL